MIDRLVDQGLLGKTRLANEQGYFYDAISLTHSGKAYLDKMGAKFRAPLVRHLGANIANLALQKDLAAKKHDLRGLQENKEIPYTVMP